MDPKTKLVVVLPTFNGGGAESVLTRLANELAAHYAITIVVVDGVGPLRERVSGEVDVVDLHCRRVRHAYRALRLALRKAQPDLVMTSFSRLNVMVMLLRLTTRMRFKVVLREVNTPSQSLSQLQFGRLYRLLYRLLYPRADAIVCQSRQMRRELIDDFGLDEQLTVQIYNPVDERFPTASESLVDPYAGKGRNLLAIGRLADQKGYDRLVDAFSEVAKKCPDCHLTILGEGENRQPLESQIESLGLSGTVRLPGYVADPVPWVLHADLVVSSSRYEGLPNVLIESIAAGTPVVATDCPGGTKEVVVPGVNGWLCDNDSASLAASLYEALRSSGIDRERVRASATKFSAPEICRQYRQLFAQALSGGLRKSAGQ